MSGAAVSDAQEAPSDVQELHPWDPHKAAKDVEVGDYYFKRKNYKAAIERYKHALIYKQDDAIATYRLAESLDKTGNSTEAVNLLSGISENPSAWALCCRRGESYFSSGSRKSRECGREVTCRGCGHSCPTPLTFALSATSRRVSTRRSDQDAVVCRTRVSDPHKPCDTLTFLMAAPDTLKREAPDSLMLTGFWYRALPSEKVKDGAAAQGDAARNSAGNRARSQPQSCSHFATPVLIVACRFPAADLTGSRSSAVITAGNSTRPAGNAA